MHISDSQFFLTQFVTLKIDDLT